MMQNTNMPVEAPDPLSAEQQRPRSTADLFWSFSMLALQGVGGVMSVAQRELVDRKRWLSREEFLGDWAVAQILPGPNVINLSLMIGDRHFGLRGALAALAGMLAFPLIIVLLLALLFTGIGAMPTVQGALRGMGGVVVGLIAANGVKLMDAVKGNVMGWLMCVLLGALTFVAVALLRVPLLWVLLVMGGFAWAWAWFQLGRAESARTRP